MEVEGPYETSRRFSQQWWYPSAGRSVRISWAESRQRRRYANRSSGDIISSISFIHDVACALKDSGGAVTEYSHTCDDIGRCLALLTSIEQVKLPFSSSQGHTETLCNAIQGQISNLRARVEGFEEKVRKYDPKLGEKAPRGWNHGMLQKAKWVVRFRKEIPKAWAEINQHSELIFELYRQLHL